jgi:hypothetical protein
MYTYFQKYVNYFILIKCETTCHVLIRIGIHGYNSQYQYYFDKNFAGIDHIKHIVYL